MFGVEGRAGEMEGVWEGGNTILTECVVDQFGLSDILKELGRSVT